MLFGTRLCLQSLVCYTLVLADAEKGLRAKAQALPFGGLVHHTPCGQYLEGKKQVLSDKQKQRLLSGTTIHEVHRLLGTAFRYAVEWGILIKSPVPVDSPKKSTQERSIWDVGEMQAALASMEDPILHLAVHLTLVGALREGEVAGLTHQLRCCRWHGNIHHQQIYAACPESVTCQNRERLHSPGVRGQARGQQHGSGSEKDQNGIFLPHDFHDGSSERRTEALVQASGNG